MAYGSPAGVAAHAKIWTRGGEFYDASASPLVAPTNPTLTQVTAWIEQISNVFDAALSSYGFSVPVVSPKFSSLITLEVERLVADLVERSHGLGKLVQDSVLVKGYMSIIGMEILDWVKFNLTGLENDGVPRTLPSANYAGGFSVSPNRQG
jgi:hypothetical protein